MYSLIADGATVTISSKRFLLSTMLIIKMKQMYIYLYTEEVPEEVEENTSWTL